MSLASRFARHRLADETTFLIEHIVTLGNNIICLPDVLLANCQFAVSTCIVVITFKFYHTGHHAYTRFIIVFLTINMNDFADNLLPVFNLNTVHSAGFIEGVVSFRN